MTTKQKYFSYHPRKNGLQQEAIERNDEAPPWLRQQKNRAYRVTTLPYNAIFGRDSSNTFEVVLHSTYLCLKVLASFSAITVCGSHKEARNIERGFTPGHKNVHFLREGTDQHEP
jgi:hypothetical protein